MARVRHSPAAHRRKKRVLKKAKGYFLQRSKRFRQAIKTVRHAMVYAYRDRKVRKREFKSLWIVRINAACKESGITYSRFIKGLINAKVTINRKMLADLAVNSPQEFKELILIAQKANTSKAGK